MAIRRKNKYDIPGLETEIDDIYKAMEGITGKAVKELPSASNVIEGANFFVQQENGSFEIYKKINGEFKRMYVDVNSLVFWDD